MKLIDFAAARSLAVWSTKLQYLDIHDTNWMFPDWSTYNQLNRFVTDRRHFFNVNVDTFKGRSQVSIEWCVSMSAWSSTFRKLDAKELRSYRRAEVFSAQLTTNLRRSQRVWWTVGQHLPLLVETVHGFKRPLRQKNGTINVRGSWSEKLRIQEKVSVVATRDIVEDYRERRDKKRLFRRKKRARKGESMRKLKCTDVQMTLENSIKRLSA